MKKLLRGIIDYRKNVRPGMKDVFAKLALGQRPDTMLIACSDSRVAVNVFASTDPGDLFVVRNVGNIVPPPDAQGSSMGDVSPVVAVEFAVQQLEVSSIIVCGHSECGAINALISGRRDAMTRHFRDWLAHAAEALDPSKLIFHASRPVSQHNRISQKNVLLQIEHLKGYPFVKQRIAEGKLRLFGWWFDIAEAEVYAWDEDANSFVILDEIRATTLLGRLENP
jgi:carbonic anhydrase